MGKKLKYLPKFTEADFNHQVFAARRAPDRRHFRRVECEGCGIVYSEPACDPSQLTSLYETAEVNYKDLEAQIYRSYVPALDRGLAATPGRRAVVEIGGGPGFMLKYGAQNGFAEQIEIEPDADAERKFVPASPRARSFGPDTSRACETLGGQFWDCGEKAALAVLPKSFA